LKENRYTGIFCIIFTLLPEAPRVFISGENLTAKEFVLVAIYSLKRDKKCEVPKKFKINNPIVSESYGAILGGF